MPDIRYPHIAERLFNTPLLIMPAKLDAIIAGLSSRIGIDAMQFGQDIGAYTTYTGERKQPGYRVVDGVGVIDVYGALTHRTKMQADSTWLLGYDQLSRMFEAAMVDMDVKAIVLNMDSPGGEVGGVFDLAEQIYTARGVKPIHAIAGNLSASATYLLGSAADELSITSTGFAGSIGVVMRHADFSVAMEKDGVKITHIFAGSHKIDGNPYEALPDKVRAKFQEEIDALYSMFVSAVSAYRALTEEQVIGTQAQVYMGQKAIDAKLVDRLETPDQLISRLSASIRQTHTPRAAARTNQKETTMSTETQLAAEAQAVITQDQVDAARAEGVQEGVTQGAQAERERIKNIMTAEEAVGREAQASTIALETEMDAESAIKVLTVSPKFAAVNAGNSEFERHMALNSNSKIDAGGETPNDDVQATVQRIINS